MSDERRDDEILGRALGRAIETIDANETPYERSRMIAAPRRSGFGLLQVAGVAVAVVLAVGFGAWFNAAREGTEPGPVAGSASPAPTLIVVPASPTHPPAPTATPGPGNVDHSVVYFARRGLPPIAAHVNGVDGASVDGRVRARLGALGDRAGTAPAGAMNAFPQLTSGTVGFGVLLLGGDLVQVDFGLPAGGWGIPATDREQATELLQQLVYTATEEPGLRRVQLTQNGQPMTIGPLRVDKPLAREDVFGYSATGPVSDQNAITVAGNDAIPHVVPELKSLANDGTTTRLTFVGTTGGATAVDLASATITMNPYDDTQPVGGKTAAALNGGKYQLSVAFKWNGGGTSGGVAGTTIYDETPLRSIVSVNPTWLIELDDARPWRAWMPDKTQLVVEIGGDPRATSDRIAVTAPKPGDQVTGSIRVTGAARVFEANVVWRMKDSTGKAIANGHFLASLGSSSLWGTFDTQLAIPGTLRGSATLELYEVSAKDGSEQGLVAIPITVR